MSRSYKKHPFSTDGNPKTLVKSKRHANKVVRRYNKDISNGKFYKRLFCSYDIHDYISRWSWAEAKRFYEELDEHDYRKKLYTSEKEFYKCWRKYYKGK